KMTDEVHTSTIQQNLNRLYMNNYIDPAGFNNSLRNFQNDYCGTIGRQFAEGFITGDAITAASIYLTIVAETAFTNTLFVAMPAEAAANGDFLLPTVFHSVQSDESRHISNGYATLLMALSDESTTQLPQRARRAGKRRAGSSAPPSRGSVEPDLEQGLRARGRPVLRHRLARQLLADRPDDGQGLRVVRAQGPGVG